MPGLDPKPPAVTVRFPVLRRASSHYAAAISMIQRRCSRRPSLWVIHLHDGNYPPPDRSRDGSVPFWRFRLKSPEIEMNEEDTNS